MRILLANDDGIDAPGLVAMYRALDGDADVTVVAPESAQSGTGHAITLTEPLLVRRVEVAPGMKGVALSGRPADCVKFAICELMPEPPDLVIAGINDGANTGMNVFYSGTIAAAAEGTFLGIPSFAVSLKRSEQMDFDTAGRIAWSLIRQVHDSGMDADALISINIPGLNDGPPRGVRVVSQSMLCWLDHFEHAGSRDGHEVYWLRGDFEDLHGEADSDFETHNAGYVTITPLRFNITDRRGLAALEQRDWRLPDHPARPPE